MRYGKESLEQKIAWIKNTVFCTLPPDPSARLVRIREILDGCGYVYRKGENNMPNKVYILPSKTGEHHDELRNFWEEQAKDLEKLMGIGSTPEGNSHQRNRRIKWNGSKNSFGYFWGLMLDNGLIDPPNQNAPDNDLQFAKLLLEHFDLGSETNPADLMKEISRKTNTLPADKRDLFQIPSVKLVASKGRNRKE